MDGDLLRRAGGRVVVTALAGTPGLDYATATANGVRHFRALGAADVVGAPDAREDPAGAVAAVRAARLLVLPGGSPPRLLRALRATGLDEVIADLLAADAVVVGSSAGAMVLCAWTVLPGAGAGAGAVAVEPGLGLVDDVLVVPHWDGEEGRTGWLRSIAAVVPASTLVLGIPEQAGVLVNGDLLTAVGSRPVRLVGERRDLQPGSSWQRR